MPVEVRHGGGDIGGMAALALLAGQLSKQQPQAQIYDPEPRGRGRGGGGGAPRRRPAPRPGSRQTVGDMLWYRNREERIHDLRMREQAAQVERENWKYEFTEKQRAEKMKRQEAIRELRGNPAFTQDQVDELEIQASVMDALQNPTLVMKNTEERRMDDISKLLASRGHELNKPFVNPDDGATYMPTLKDGQLVYEMKIRGDQSREYLQEKMENDRRKMYADAWSKLGTTKVAGKDGRDRMLTQEEKLNEFYRMFPEKREEDVMREIQLERLIQEDEAQRRTLRAQAVVEERKVKEAEAENWMQSASQQGLIVHPSDADLGKDVGMAYATLRTAKENPAWAQGVPGGQEAVQKAVAAATDIVLQHEEQQERRAEAERKRIAKQAAEEAEREREKEDEEEETPFQRSFGSMPTSPLGI